MSSYKYDAFITYCSDPDYNTSRQVETFLKKIHKLGKHQENEEIKSRLRELHICRDGTTFKSRKGKDQKGLSEEIFSHLSASQSLIVLCSYNILNHSYCNLEIAYFFRQFPDRKTFICITEGHDIDKDIEKLVPPLLLKSEGFNEVRYDLRGLKGSQKSAHKLRDAEEELLRLAADLYGDELIKPADLDTLWKKQERRAAHVRISVIGAIAILLTCFAGYFFYSNTKLRDASVKISAQRDSLVVTNKVISKQGDSLLRLNGSLEEVKKQTADLNVQKENLKKETDDLKKQKDSIELVIRANSLVVQAGTMLDNDPTISYELALAAFRICKTPEACNALFMAYASAPFYRVLSCKRAEIFPGGEKIAVVDNEGNLKVMNWSGKEIGGPFGKINSADDFYIACSDNKTLITCAYPWSIIKLFNIESKSEDTWDFIGKRGGLIHRAISRDGTRFASLAHDGKILFWNVSDKDHPYAQIDYPGTKPAGGAFTPDNRIFITWEGKKIRFLDIALQKITDSIVELDEVYDVKISNLSSTGQRYFNFMNYSTAGKSYLLSNFGKPIIVSKIFTPSTRFCYSYDDEEMLHLNTYDNYTEEWYTHNPALRYRLSIDYSDRITCVAFSHRRGFIIAGSKDREAMIWQDGKKLFSLKGHGAALKYVLLSNDASRAFTVSEDGKGRLWAIPEKDDVLEIKDALKAQLNNIVRYNSKSNHYELKSEDSWEDVGLSPEEIILKVEKMKGGK